jgi:hypothetical protein
MTKVSLRKAKALQNSILENITALPIITEVGVSEFENPLNEINELKDKFTESMITRTRLLDAMYEIRTSVGTANSEGYINALLADLAKKEKNITFYQTLSRIAPRMTLAVMGGKLDKIRNRQEESYGRGDVVNSSIFNADEIKSFKTDLAKLKKAKQKIQDELLELNVHTEITLSVDTVNTLKDENIL